MYNARITREHRTAIIILSDTSGSMTEMIRFNGEQMSKAEAVALIINMFIEELINRSRREEGIRDYFDIALLGYGKKTCSLLDYSRDFATVSELAGTNTGIKEYQVLRELPNGNQVLVTKMQRSWIEPKAAGPTPMGEALSQAEKLARNWCADPRNRDSFPPIIMNITDGEASDAEPPELCRIAENIKSIATTDGNVLFFNIHLAPGDGAEITASGFPCGINEVPAHRYARLLYDMSSEMPQCFNSMIASFRPESTPPFRAMSYNCPLDELFSILTIGSVSISLTI